MDDQRLEEVKKKIGAYPDFPKPGVVFRDIFSVLADPPTFRILMSLLKETIQTQCPDVDVIVGLESRGFLLGTTLALALEKPFAPIRKKGKLPGELKQVSYSLEYGTDVFEAQKDSVKSGQNVVIVDDLLATGGTMKAACDLVRALEGKVGLCLVCIELSDLKGRDKIKDAVVSLITY